MNPEKRRIYQRIMREAKERVEMEREKENIKRRKEGKALLPEDTFNIDVQTMCQKLFDQIEDSKKFYDKVEIIKRKRMHKDLETRKLAKEVEKEVEREWEDNRDKRAKDWRKFQQVSKGGRKRGKYEFKAPKTKMESRPNSAKKTEEGKPLGIDDTYKREWK